MADVSVLAVEHDVSEKLDTAPIARELQAIDIIILYSCTNDDAWQNENTTDDFGKPMIVIKLPYHSVKRMKKENVNKMMLKYARERLRQIA